MSRYVNEISTVKSPEEIAAVIQQFMAKEGFTLRTYDNGQKVWQKGDGFVTAPQFMFVSLAPGKARVEAWCKFAVLPGVYGDEMDLEGFVGIAVKKPLKKRVTALERLLAG